MSLISIVNSVVDNHQNIRVTANKKIKELAYRHFEGSDKCMCKPTRKCGVSCPEINKLSGNAKTVCNCGLFERV